MTTTATQRIPTTSPFTNLLVEHYLKTKSRQQRGSGSPYASSYPVFRGAPLQYGSGLGNFFRSIGRFLIPIATSVASSFLTSAAQGIGEGKSIKEATKGALVPSIRSATSSLDEQIIKRINPKTNGEPQKGKGRKRKHVRSALYKHPKKACACKKPRSLLTPHFSNF